MGKKSSRATSLLAGLLLLPSAAFALPAIVFDTTPGGAGGSITYNGAGGPAVGTDIQFVEIAAIDAPLNSGVVLNCVDCLLDFVTGANVLEGPPQYTWLGGGSFVLTGDVPALGLDNATLLSGSFTGTPNTPGLVASANSGLFLGLGVDTKNSTLAAFYGLAPTPWVFANTEIALNTLTVSPTTGAFTAGPNQADIVNAQIPEPATLLLLGSGLVAIGWWKRRG